MSVDIDLIIRHHFSEDLYAKEMHLPAGFKATTHKHADDHISALFKGRALVEVNGKAVVHNAPAFIMIRAGLEHQITALDDVTWFCVHETDETDIERIDRVLIERN